MTTPPTNVPEAVPRPTSAPRAAAEADDPVAALLSEPATAEPLLADGAVFAEEVAPLSLAAARRPEPAPKGVVARIFARVDALPLEWIVPAMLRLIAVAWLLTGIGHWLRIVGYLPWRGRLFGEMPVEWQSAIVFYGVFDLITAVGLWLATSWGVILWLIAVAAQVLTHSALSEIFGERPIRVPFHIVTVALYFLLYWRLRAKRRAADDA